MGSGSGDKMEGKMDELKGTAKEKGGDLLDDESMSDEGKNQQLKGEGKQAWGDVKDTGQDLKERAEDTLNKSKE